MGIAATRAQAGVVPSGDHRDCASLSQEWQAIDTRGATHDLVALHAK
jgi:hypothetical protein